MKIHEFFHLYAGVPLAKRFQIFNFYQYGDLTLSAVHKRISKIEKQKYELENEEEMMLKLVEPYLLKNSLSE